MKASRSRMHAAATAQQKASQPIATLEDISTSSPALSHARAACSPASQAGPTSSYPRTRQKSMQSSRNAPTPAALTTSDGRARVGTSFQPVPRVSVSSSDLDNMIAKHEKCGIPLIVEGWHEHPSWSKDLFSLDYLLEEFANDPISVRNVVTMMDTTLPFSDFISRSRSATQSADDEPLYGKDANCPSKWRDWVVSENALPESLRPGAPNDLLQFLRNTESVESIMCYLGNQGTFTPCHKDLCGSSGHNIMCHTEDGGHSLWYMMASHDALAVDDYFRNCIGKELDWEEHVATEEEFASAPFTVYVAEQRLGDLILIPPRSCHQVVNRGGLTVKNSWSRMTVEGLKVALHHELPIYRRVCRPELYRIRNILHRSLLHFTEVLKRYKPSVLRHSPSENDVETLSKLFELFDFVLLQEFSTDHASLPHVVPPGAHLPHPTDNSESIPFNSIRSVFSGSRLIQEDLTMGNNKPASYFMCDFCGADIFQSFFECHECATSDTTKNVGDGLIICPPCYAEGRTCRCGNMGAIQLRPFDELLQARNGALGVLLDHIRGEELTRLHEKGNFLGIFENSDTLTFKAACVLRERREEIRSAFPRLILEALKQALRTCRTRPPHKEPASWIISCVDCHGGKCFKHILRSWGIHSVDALLASPSSKVWHRYHSKWGMEHRQSLKSSPDKHVVELEKTGAIPKLRDKLYYAAHQYKRCKPLNPSSTKLGWYDEVMDEQDDGLDCASDSYEAELQVDSDITEDSYEMTSDPQTEDSDGYIPHETPKRRSGNIFRRASQTQPTIKSKVAIETAPEAHKEDPPLVTSDDIFARPGSPLTSICDSPSPFNDDQSTHQKSKSRLVFDGIELISRPPFLSHKRREFGPIVATQRDQSSKPKRRLSVDSSPMGSGRGDILADMLSAAKGKQRARDSHVDVTSETPRSPRVAKRRRISDHLKATTTHEFLTELDDPIRDFPESSKAPSSSRCSRNRSGPPGIRAENLNAHLRRRDNQHPGNRSLDNTPYKGKDVRILGSNGRATPVIESLQLTHSTNHHFSTNCDSLDIIRSLEEERDELKAIVKDHRSQLASRPTRAEFESFKKDIEKSFEAKFESRLKDLETKLEKKPVEKKRFAGLPNFQKTSEPLKAVGVSTRSSADAVGELRDHVRKMFDNESSNRFDEWVEALRPLLDATMPKYIQSRAEVLDEQLGERIKELLTGKNSSQFTNLLQPIVAGIMNQNQPLRSWQFSSPQTHHPRQGESQGGGEFWSRGPYRGRVYSRGNYYQGHFQNTRGLPSTQHTYVNRDHLRNPINSHHHQHSPFNDGGFPRPSTSQEAFTPNAPSAMRGRGPEITQGRSRSPPRSVMGTEHRNRPDEAQLRNTSASGMSWAQSYVQEGNVHNVPPTQPRPFDPTEAEIDVQSSQSRVETSVNRTQSGDSSSAVP